MKVSNSLWTDYLWYNVKTLNVAFESRDKKNAIIQNSTLTLMGIL